MAERLKVLGVHAGGGIGGAPISLVQLLASLPPSGFEVAVAFTEPGAMPRLAAERGLRTLVVRAPAAFYYSAHAALRPRMLAPFLLRFRASVHAAERLLQAEQPDVLHLNTSVLLPFGVAARRAGVPVLWQVREVLGPRPLVRGWHARFILGHASAIVATSEPVRASLEGVQRSGSVGQSRLPRAESDRVEVVPNAVDLRQFDLGLLSQRPAVRAELGLADSTPVVALLGSVQREKGHWLLLDALPALREVVPNTVVLVVAGGVPLAYARSWKGRLKRAIGAPMDNLDRLRRDAERRGLANSLRVTGFRSDIPRLLAAADALVFPSLREEGFGRPLIEAMAMARPVVATDVGASAEILGGAGLLTPVGDPTALARALAQVLSDPALARDLGRRGRARVEHEYALPRQVERMAALYRRVARQGGHAR